VQNRRSTRFRRIATVASIKLAERDRTIIKFVHRHRFLRSRQIIALVGGSKQQILRRLQLLFHHGYLERPRAQLRYYERGGSEPIVYGLGNKGGSLLRKERGTVVDSDAWSEKNNAIGRVYLDHALFVSEIMVSTELACRKHGIRLLHEDELELPKKEGVCRWWVKILGGMRLGVVPDQVFALEYADRDGNVERTHFFLEADRGTMPVVRTNLNQTSFRRKLLAYEATWANKVHQRHLGIQRFRVLTVTTIPGRVESLLEACSRLKRGHGLFLFADQAAQGKDLLSRVWRSCKDADLHPLLG
jgi:hypothetical protein